MIEPLKNSKINRNIYVVNNSKIGIVDFRNILKESLTMKKIGKEFLKLEKILNDKIKKEEEKLQTIKLLMLSHSHFSYLLILRLISLQYSKMLILIS